MSCDAPELLFTVIATKEPDNDLPKYSDVGYIAVEILSISTDKRALYKYEAGEEHVATACGFWITEGMGFEYFICEYVKFPEVGYYHIKNLKGAYIRGDGWEVDDDEEWDFDEPVKITKAEFEKLI